MMTWEGHWGVDVELQYEQHEQQEYAGIQLQACTHPCDATEDDTTGPALVYESIISYNRNSVLAITPKALLPMIVSQVILHRIIIQINHFIMTLECQALLPFVVLYEPPPPPSTPPPSPPPAARLRPWRPAAHDFSLTLGDEDRW